MINCIIKNNIYNIKNTGYYWQTLYIHREATKHNYNEILTALPTCSPTLIPAEQFIINMFLQILT